jgi:uncharacterized protein
MEIINQVKQEIKRIDPEAEVILFGSRARGDYREDSDGYFLILLERPLDSTLKSIILERLYELELISGEVISALIHAKADWPERAITPFCQIIAKEGIRA